MEEDILEMEDLLSPINNNYRKRRTHPRVKVSRKIAVIAVFSGVLLPILLPTAHMFIFYFIWGSGDVEVDKNVCTCDCWDTVFKGPYESGVGKYKHVFFNSDRTTFKMWIATVLFFIALYEGVKYTVLLVVKRRMRWSMALLVLSSIHSHYYAWWGHWNYWNDDFYVQWGHQLFFTTTEVISTALVFSQMDKSHPTQPLLLIIIGTIALFHICSAMGDQFFTNVLQLNGKFHQIIRDVLLMTTDCIQVGVVWHELKKCAERRTTSVTKLLATKPHLLTLTVTFFAMMLYILVCP